jgi:diacylglycerol kinase (ATP)
MKNQAFYRRLSFALQGIASALRSEASFRQQTFMAFALLGILIWRNPPMVWWAILLINCALVLAAELFNTALEHTLDLVSPEIHPSVKLAKDCSAGAVLVLSMSSLISFIAFIYVSWLH